MAFLAKTRFDYEKQKAPALFAAMEKRIQSLSARTWPLTTDELIEAGALHDINRSLREAMGLSMAERFQMTYDEMASLTIKYAAYANFIEAGQKVFRFSGNLAARLADTELNVEADFLIPPFSTCMFTYDDDETRESLSSLLGRRLPLSHGGKFPAPTVSVIISHFPGGDEEEPNLRMVVVAGDERHDYALVKRSLLLKSGTTVEDAIRTDWRDILPDCDDEHEEAHFYDEGFRFFRTVLNSILYLASANPDISGELRSSDSGLGDAAGLTRKQRRDLAKKMDRRSELPYVNVGGTLPARDSDGNGMSNALASRVEVRGHWRNQAHGPGRSERKLIFIEPHWRGPDMAAAIQKAYHVR